jgi:hypothetical protein
MDPGDADAEGGMVELVFDDGFIGKDHVAVSVVAGALVEGGDPMADGLALDGREVDLDHGDWLLTKKKERNLTGIYRMDRIREERRI